MKKVEEVKKSKKKKEIIDELSEIDDSKLSQKIIDLCMWYQMENSYRWIGIIDHKIKFCDIKIQHLLDSKPFFFQKSKLEKFNKELDELEQEKIKLKEEINEEVSMISKMEESISRDETSEYKDSNKLISYYELLSLLKMGVIYEKVILHKFDDTMTYIFDGDNYIIEEENDADDRFEIFLSDCDADIAKFDKNIQLIENKN